MQETEATTKTSRRRHQRGGGGESEAVEVIISRGIFFDVDVALGDVGFGLVVVVVADEVGDGVVGEDFLEFFVKLGGEGFVVGDDEHGAAELGGDVGHGEGFSGAGDAHEDLVLFSFVEAFDEGVDGGGLVAGGFVGGFDLEGFFEHGRGSGGVWRIGDERSL